MVGRAGFEPAKALPSDLQSDPFGRSGTSPNGQGPLQALSRVKREGAQADLDSDAGCRYQCITHVGSRPRELCSRAIPCVFRCDGAIRSTEVDGASDGTRTHDHLITNQGLYQLSYTGLSVVLRVSPRGRRGESARALSGGPEELGRGMLGTRAPGSRAKCPRA